MLVFLKFFIDEEKETHWIGPIEHVLAKIGSVDMAEVFITLSAVLIVQSALPSTESMQFLVAGIAGICTFIIVDILGQLVELAKSAATTMGKGLISAGFANFLYLEVVDASFSFDGVIGAFAITKNFLLIAIGLGIGAMFVRSMTIYLVEKKTLQAFKYLEHGAFWSIGMLAAIMFASTITHIPELATGLLTLATIGAAVWHSIKTSKQGELA
jgi:hypothetical protein